MIAQAENETAPVVIAAEPIDAAAEAQTAQADPNSGPQTPAKKQSPYTQFIFIGLIFVMLYFVMFRGPKKKQQKQKQMMSSLKKNDRVQTIGGIMGTIIDVADNEITLKIDESNNTKMKIVSNAIARVIEQ